MNNFKLLYITFAVCVYGFYTIIDDWKIKNLQEQKNTLIKQATVHFQDQVNVRQWNAQYGGVYVKPTKGQKPNPYLIDNIIKVDKDLTLIKINPAWMTRQLSEQSDVKNYSFKITSLTPINPNNKANIFEQKALTFLKYSKERTFYEFSSDNKFNFMGALVTTPSCLQCHAHQGYQVGDVRGGISIQLDSSKYTDTIESIKNKALSAQILIFMFLLSITLLLRNQFNNATALAGTVVTKTNEVFSTKKLLQSILDNDKHLLLVSDGKYIIFANKTLLNFIDVKDISTLQDDISILSNKFEKQNDPDFLYATMIGTDWMTYLHQGHSHEELKLLMIQDEEKHYFKVITKDMIVDKKLHQVIRFVEVSNEVF